MRVFTNERIYDKYTKQWIDNFMIDSVNVDLDTFLLESEIEMEELKPELTEDEKYDNALVEQYACDIENMQSLDSESELRNILYDLLCTSREIGYENCRREIEENSELDEVSELDNGNCVHIHALTVNDVSDCKKLIEQLNKYASIRSGDYLFG